jgi:hypothetical protein
MNNLSTNFGLYGAHQIASDHINSAKWNRWLYRYSILHRKILKNSHKLTLSKRLINSGFYNKGLFDKNIWASENLSKYSNTPDLFNSFFNVYYNSFFETHNNWASTPFYILNQSSNFTNLTSLNFYENSFFWFLKRYYLFNTIPTNTIKSKLKNAAETSLSALDDKRDGSFLKYYATLSYLLKSQYVNLAQFSHFNNTTILFDVNDETSCKSNKNFSHFLLKDIYISFFDNDVLNRENLNILYWVTSAPISESFNLSFFDYVLFGSNNNFTANFATFKSNDTCEDTCFNFLLVLSLSNLDSFYLNDINDLLKL